jgi:dTDP-4-amino-4,6-dideoxygalactose transaminase
MTMRPAIPLFKVAMSQEAIAAAGEALESGFIAEGKVVSRFERELGHYLNHPEPLLTNDPAGTTALALRLAGVGTGDEVIVSPLACTATVTPIVTIGARPIWSDVDPNTGMPCPHHLEAQITSRTRAILFYHWNGDVGDIVGAVNIGRTHNIPVIEDATEAFGATIDGRPLGGNNAFATIYSLQAVRQFTAVDGGVLLLADQVQRDRARRLRKYGIDLKSFRLPNGEINPNSDIPEVGYYLCSNDVFAAIGLANLTKFDSQLMARRINAEYFDHALKSVPGIRISEQRANVQSAFWTYCIQASNRDALAEALRAVGISCQILHVRADHYSCFDKAESLEGVETFSSKTLSLPCGWWLDDHNKTFIVQTIKNFSDCNDASKIV